jgi:maleamate amidohydrolase
MTNRNWLDVVPEEDRRTYQHAGFHGGQKLGDRPALIVVDVTYGFAGSPGLSLEQAIDEFSTACGPAAWAAMPRIEALIKLFRRAGRPIVFTNSDASATPFTGKATRSKRAGAPVPRFNDFPAQIAPAQGEWILSKTKASCFFGTPLAVYLVQQQVSDLVICGVSTSGCVRASVVDAFSHGFKVFVVDDCCFDRSWFAHSANLYDMDAKYASVLPLEQFTSQMSAKALRGAA